MNNRRPDKSDPAESKTMDTEKRKSMSVQLCFKKCTNTRAQTHSPADSFRK